MTDSEDRILFGIRTDGTVDWGLGVPKLIVKELDEIKQRLKVIEDNTHNCKQ